MGEIEKKIGNTVSERKKFLDDVCTRATTALSEECERNKKLANMQTDTQFNQQKQALEMQRDQLRNQLECQEQQEKYTIGQRAAQAQQQRAQMELAQQMQKAMYGNRGGDKQSSKQSKLGK